MDAPAHMFVDSAKVSFSTTATSLWQREAATIEKSLEGNTGTLSLSPIRAGDSGLHATLAPDVAHTQRLATPLLPQRMGPGHGGYGR